VLAALEGGELPDHRLGGPLQNLPRRSKQRCIFEKYLYLENIFKYFFYVFLEKVFVFVFVSAY
jgi:hypothetical protein